VSVRLTIKNPAPAKYAVSQSGMMHAAMARRWV